jgi:putative ABC transport system permease protein
VIASGEWWPTDYSGPALVSVSEQLRAPLGLKLGDKLTFLIFGDEVEATISSFRKFDWQRGRINFPMILSPGAFDAFPLSYFAFMKIRPGAELDVERQLMADYPHLTFIPVEEALDVLRNMVDGISTAIAIVGTVAVLSGMLVLAGALAAGRRQREADAVVAKVLGATRTDVVSGYLIEYGLVSGLSAVLAIGLGIFGAWAFAVLAVDILFSVDPLLISVVVGVAFGVTLAIGAATTWRALSVKPARFLREE